jgi:hypothetical protein
MPLLTLDIPDAPDSSGSPSPNLSVYDPVDRFLTICGVEATGTQEARFSIQYSNNGVAWSRPEDAFTLVGGYSRTKIDDGPSHIRLYRHVGEGVSGSAGLTTRNQGDASERVLYQSTRLDTTAAVVAANAYSLISSGAGVRVIRAAYFSPDADTAADAVNYVSCRLKMYDATGADLGFITNEWTTNAAVPVPGHAVFPLDLVNDEQPMSDYATVGVIITAFGTGALKKGTFTFGLAG